MIKICHRINSIQNLQNTPSEYGIEVDIHAYANDLVVHHDPFQKGVLFDEWLGAYHHKFLILNIKEEGIESKVRDIVRGQNINDFFMLDLSFPALIKMANSGEKSIALRLSKYEAIESVLLLSGKCDWVWVDLFNNDLPFDSEGYKLLKDNQFKMCLVSPELHGRDMQDINIVRQNIKEMDITIDAICTTHPSMWEGEYTNG